MLCSWVRNLGTVVVMLGTFAAGAAVAQESFADWEWGHSRIKAFLYGSYGFTLSEFCVETPRQPAPAEGFDPDTRTLLQDAEAVNAVLTGIMRFDRDDNVFIEDASISDLFIDLTNAGDVPIATGTPVSCEGTFAVDRRARLAVSLTCAAELPNNIDVTIEPFELDGFVGRFGGTVPISSTVGNIQTETIRVGGQVVAERERVCLLRGTLAKLAR